MPRQVTGGPRGPSVTFPDHDRRVDARAHHRRPRPGGGARRPRGAAASTGSHPTPTTSWVASGSAPCPRRASCSPASPRSTTCTSVRPSAGWSAGSTSGPIFRSEPGTEPYPELMNRGAVDEMLAIDPAVVVVKGDLTSGGEAAEYQAFLDRYEPAFGARLRPRPRQPRRLPRRHVRGVPHPGGRAPGRAPGRARHLPRGPRRAASSAPSSSTGSTRSRPSPTVRCWCSGTTTRGTPTSGTRAERLLRHRPHRLRGPGRRGRPAAVDPRLLRRPHAPQPRAHASRPPDRCRGSRWPA